MGIVTLKVPDDMEERWKATAERRGLNLSEMIRQSVNDCLPTDTDIQVRERFVFPPGELARWREAANSVDASLNEFVRVTVNTEIRSWDEPGSNVRELRKP